MTRLTSYLSANQRFFRPAGCPSISVRPQRKYAFGMYFLFSCLIRLQLIFSSFDAFLARKTFVPSNGEILVRHVRRNLRYRSFLKYSHCHHRNHLYNPHIQNHYPKSSPQGLALDLELSLMTKTGFLHLQRLQFPTPFCLFFLCAASSQHTRVFHARDGAIFSKNSTFVFFDGASPGGGSKLRQFS